MAATVETDNLVRTFGPIRAVDGVSFAVGPGDVLGFLGPNGAGKSTTMKMLTCFLLPSAGSARVGGFDVEDNPREVRELIGYLPENAPLYGEMTVKHFLEFVAEVRSIEAEKRSKAVERVAELTSLGSVMSQRVETLSKGFKRRVGLAQALIHDPKILILDEPTDGLDPNQKHEVRQLISRMASDKCIILSTHILEEVDAVCNRVIIISKGKVVADDTPDGLRKRSASYGSVTITVNADNDQSIKKQIETFSAVKQVLERERTKGKTTYTLVPQGSSDLVLEVLSEAKKHEWPIDDLQVEKGNLDEVFRDITQNTSQ